MPIVLCKIWTLRSLDLRSDIFSSTTVFLVHFNFQAIRKTKMPVCKADKAELLGTGSQSWCWKLDISISINKFSLLYMMRALRHWPALVNPPRLRRLRLRLSGYLSACYSYRSSPMNNDETRIGDWRKRNLPQRRRPARRFTY